MEEFKPRDYIEMETETNMDRADGLADELEGLILTERQREFVGEGKRWYDLVRYALRHGGTSEMLAFLTRKYSNSNAIKAKLAD